jgi:hypothetical protein
MIYHDNKIKISDWSDFFDLNKKSNKEKIDMFHNDQLLTNVFYFFDISVNYFSSIFSLKT